MTNTQLPLRLAGKRALLTAAGQGIGRATALAFADNGAQVFATDISEELLDTYDHPNIQTRVLDATNNQSVREGADWAQPDVLFNGAGFVHHGDILNATDEEFDMAIDLNLRSQWRTIRASLPGMIERGTGSIINMSSVLSSVIAAPNRCIYTLSKAAVVGLTKAVAHDYITQGIRCNAICPGTVDSPSFRQRVAATGNAEQGMRDFIARQPMGRIGEPEEIAALAVYLASNESGFTTGQAHVIDGGWST